MMKKTSEQGRTLLELLAVFVVICLFTILGVVLFQEAVHDNEADRAYEDIVVAYSSVRNKGTKRTDTGMGDTTLTGVNGTETRAGKMFAVVQNCPENAFTVKVGGVDRDICARLMEKKWQSVSPISFYRAENFTDVCQNGDFGEGRYVEIATEEDCYKENAPEKGLFAVTFVSNGVNAFVDACEGCYWNGKCYENGENISECGKCVDGTIETRTSGNVCQKCSGSPGWRFQWKDIKKQVVCGDQCCATGARCAMVNNYRPECCENDGSNGSLCHYSECCDSGNCYNGHCCPQGTSWSGSGDEGACCPDSTEYTHGLCCKRGGEGYTVDGCCARSRIFLKDGQERCCGEDLVNGGCIDECDESNCFIGGSCIPNGATVGECGKCVNGIVQEFQQGTDACKECGGTETGWNLKWKDEGKTRYCGESCCANNESCVQLSGNHRCCANNGETGNTCTSADCCQSGNCSSGHCCPNGQIWKNGVCQVSCTNNNNVGEGYFCDVEVTVDTSGNHPYVCTASGGTIQPISQYGTGTVYAIGKNGRSYYESESPVASWDAAYYFCEAVARALHNPAIGMAWPTTSGGMDCEVSDDCNGWSGKGYWLAPTYNNNDVPSNPNETAGYANYLHPSSFISMILRNGTDIFGNSYNGYALCAAAVQCNDGCSFGGRCYSDFELVGTCGRCRNGTVVEYKSGNACEVCGGASGGWLLRPVDSTKPTVCGSNCCGTDERCVTNGSTKTCCSGDGSDGTACTENNCCSSGNCSSGHCCAAGAVWLNKTEGGLCCLSDRIYLRDGQQSCCSVALENGVCPDTCAGCWYEGTCVANNTSVGDCGQCVNGTIVEKSSGTSCQECSGTAGNWLLQLKDSTQTLVCGESCCNTTGHCITSGQTQTCCDNDGSEGSACTNDGCCISGNCSNGFCCASGKVWVRDLDNSAGDDEGTCCSNSSYVASGGHCCTANAPIYNSVADECCNAEGTNSEDCCVAINGNRYEWKNGQCVEKCSLELWGENEGEGGICCASGYHVSNGYCCGAGEEYYPGVGNTTGRCCIAGADSTKACCTLKHNGEYEWLTVNSTSYCLEPCPVCQKRKTNATTCIADSSQTSSAEQCCTAAGRLWSSIKKTCCAKGKIVTTDGTCCTQKCMVGGTCNSLPSCKKGMARGTVCISPSYKELGGSKKRYWATVKAGCQNLGGHLASRDEAENILCPFFADTKLITARVSGAEVYRYNPSTGKWTHNTMNPGDGTGTSWKPDVHGLCVMN